MKKSYVRTGKGPKSHPVKAVAQLPPGCHIRRVWFNCWCQFFRCLAKMLLLYCSLQQLCSDWAYLCFYVQKEWEATSRSVALRCLQVLFAVSWCGPYLCDKGHASHFKAIAVRVGMELNVIFLYSERRATGAHTCWYSSLKETCTHVGTQVKFPKKKNSLSGLHSRLGGECLCLTVKR